MLIRWSQQLDGLHHLVERCARFVDRARITCRDFARQSLGLVVAIELDEVHSQHRAGERSHLHAVLAPRVTVQLDHALQVALALFRGGTAGQVEGGAPERVERGYFSSNSTS